MPPRGKVVLVGFEDQDNLGLRYLSSNCAKRDTRQGSLSSVRDAILTFEPQVAGFSLIFQYLLPEFAEFLGQLRASGVRAHFTMGGTTPHSSPTQCSLLFRSWVVRFEGEDTLLELTHRVAAGDAWLMCEASHSEARTSSC
jgi:hypothetical protein